MSKEDMIQVFPSTGGVYIKVTEDWIEIDQEDTSGNGDNLSVSIPRPLFKEVLNTIFLKLDDLELEEIAELASSHATAAAAKRD